MAKSKVPKDVRMSISLGWARLSGQVSGKRYRNTKTIEYSKRGGITYWRRK